MAFNVVWRAGVTIHYSIYRYSWPWRYSCAYHLLTRALHWHSVTMVACPPVGIRWYYWYCISTWPYHGINDGIIGDILLLFNISISRRHCDYSMLAIVGWYSYVFNSAARPVGWPINEVSIRYTSVMTNCDIQ